ncbi:hypothetical protein A5676_17860 [Mycobacterium malmoense]|nr:hypothetical protein A5676_17860 [Mycobacterium malmoense]
MVSRGAASEPQRWRPGVAIVAVLCLIAALVGSWAVRSQAAAPASPPSIAVSHDAIGAGSAVEPSRVHADMADPASHLKRNAPTSTDQKSFKTAGIKRDRPPTWSRGAPPQWWLATPISLNTAGINAPGPDPAHTPSPIRALAGHQLLSLICIARC